MIDLDQRLAEGKVGDVLNWGIDKLTKKKPVPDRIDPTIDAPKPARVRKPKDMDNEVWTKLSPDQKRKLAGVDAPKVDAPKVDAPKVDAPKVEPDATPSTLKQVTDFAKEHPKIATGVGLVGAGAVRKMADPELPGVGAATIQNVHDAGAFAVDAADRLIRGKEVDKPANAPAAAQDAPANTTKRGLAPETDDSIPDVKESMSMATLLKLTGQRPITERDSTMGIIKPKEIKTLTESSVNECGTGMMGNSSTPASISINATAGSGDEVANMLASIMKLAGVRPVEQDMMPTQNSNMPMMKALQIMGGPDEELPPSSPDSMNSGVDYPADGGESDIELGYEPEGPGEDTGTVTVRNVDTGEEHVGRDVTEPGSITVRNVDTGEEFKGKESTDEEFSDNFKANTTPNDPTDVPKFDSNKMADMRNFIDMSQIPAGAPGDNKLPKEEPKLQESSSTDLFKAYEAFKNGN